MKNIKLLFVLGLLFMIISNFSYSAEDTTQYDYVFLVDYSGSMIGLPKDSGNSVIFPEVAKDIKRFLDSIKDGANVSIYHFDKGIQGDFSRKNINSSLLTELKNHVNSLENNIEDNYGQVTWIYLSLKDILKELDDLNQESSKQNILRIQSIFLYTDGEDNGPTDLASETVNMSWIMNKFRLQRGESENLYLKYITLGLDLPEDEEQIINETPGVELIKQPQMILEKKMFNVEVRPVRIDFGNLQKTDESVCELELTFDKELSQKYSGSNFKIAYSTPSNLDPSIKPILEPTVFDFQNNIITLNFRILKTGADIFGSYEGNIEFQMDSFRDDAEGKEILVFFTPQKIKYKFIVTPPLKIDVSAIDGGVLVKDFGSVEFNGDEKALLSRDYKVQFNEPAQELRIPVTLGIILELKNERIIVNPEMFFFKIDSVNRGAQTVLKDTSVVQFNMDLSPGMSKGVYKGHILLRADNADIGGSGLKTIEEGIFTHAVPFSFKIPWMWPSGLSSLIIVSVVFLIFVLIFSIYCKRRTKFPSSTYLSMAGSDYYLSAKGCLQSFFSGKITVGGSNSSIEVVGMPVETQFYVKLLDDESIGVFPGDKSIIKDSTDSVTISGEEFIVSVGSYFFIEISPDVFEKIEFKKD